MRLLLGGNVFSRVCFRLVFCVRYVIRVVWVV